MTTTRPGLTLSPKTRTRTRRPRSARRYLRRAVLAVALLGAFFLGLCWGLGSAPTGPRQCTDPATHERVIPGDAILNDGQEFVCTDGTLVHVQNYGNAAPAAALVPTGRVLPAGFHWRVVRYQINDCGRHNAGQAKYIVWRGNGDRQSALFCPNGSVWPS